MQMSQLERKITSVIQYIDYVILSHKKFNIRDTFFIVGTPRSGTTWLMEILGTIPGYTYLFEPLNPIRFPSGAFEIGFQSRTYLPVDTDWSKGKDYLKKVFTGHLPGPPPLPRPITILNRFLSDKLIVKSINLNRLLTR